MSPAFLGGHLNFIALHSSVKAIVFSFVMKDNFEVQRLMDLDQRDAFVKENRESSE